MHLQVITTKPLSCHGMETWQYGNSLINYMKLVRIVIEKLGDKSNFVFALFVTAAGIQRINAQQTQVHLRLDCGSDHGSTC
jgi:hypothetical protein